MAEADFGPGEGVEEEAGCLVVGEDDAHLQASAGEGQCLVAEEGAVERVIGRGVPRWYHQYVHEHMVKG